MKRPDSLPVFTLKGHRLGLGQPCFMVAEIGVNHNGDLELALKTIEAAARAGAQAVKFQTFRAEEFVADPNLSYTYSLANGKRVTETQYEMFKRLELPHEWHSILRDAAREKGLLFFSSTADPEAVELLASLGAPVLKLASEDLINIRLLEHVAQTRLPVILSTGMADKKEMLKALDILDKGGSPQVLLLHTTSSYPAPPESLNLRRISALAKEFKRLVGFSDHSQGWQAGCAARCLGACLLEKHFTLNKELNGPDHRFSADPAEFSLLVRRVREMETMLGPGGLNFSPLEETGRKEYRRSIVAQRDISPGEIITEDMLAYKRPGLGLSPLDRDLIIGKKAIINLNKNQLITLKDLK